MKEFTLEEANQLLPVIAKELHLLQMLQEAFESDYETYKNMEFFMTDEEMENWEIHFQALEVQAESYIHNILSHGVLFHDLENGVIHFPAIVGETKGIFKWTPDEPNITWYEKKNNGTNSTFSLAN